MATTKTILEVCLDPVELEVEDLEDILVTDPLFADYLNQYLALPIFPEKIQFNSKSGVFEIDQNASGELTDKLRALVRSHRKPPPLYKAAREHSYRDIPLINVEGEKISSPEEIDTTLHVKVLNKEQSIGWIKKERFNMFLKSDCYLQYRLSKIISQARSSMCVQLFTDSSLASRLCDVAGNDVTMVTVLPRPTSRRIRKETEVFHADEKKLDDRLMERCYVSLGNTPSSETRAWISQATLRHETTTTMSHHTPQLSTKPQPLNARPLSSLSILEKSRLGSDSGFSSPTKSLFSEYSGFSEQSESPFSKPNTPRPTETVCVIGSSMINQVKTAVRVETKPIDYIQEEEDETKSLHCDDADQLASVITGTVLKYSIAEVTGRQLKDVAESAVVNEILPDKIYKELSMGDLERLSVQSPGESRPPFTPTEEKNAEKSDEESLMNSDDEFADERDRYFRRKLAPIAVTGAVGRLKSIEEFRRFLVGTAGEMLWNLWVDIDRLSIGTNKDEINDAVSSIRLKYMSYPANRSASSGVIQILRDWDSGRWTVEQLKILQRDLAKRLLLYWSPRYLMSRQRGHQRQIHTIKNQWNVVLTGSRCPAETFPNPKVKDPLPLRPKSCLPRRLDRKIDVMKIPTSQEHPPIGYKRTYAGPSLEYAYGHVPKVEEMLMKAKMRRSDSEAEKRPSSAALSRTPSSARIQIEEKERPTSAQSTESEFLGGQRSERLLQALAKETMSGSFFRAFAERSEKPLWQNSLKFWTDLQKYHELFYSDSFDRYRIERLAKHIYSMYIVEGARYSIECATRVRRQIQKEMDPPFEDLFDATEERALVALHDAWKQMNKEDAVGFGRVEQVEVSRNFRTKNKEFLSIQAKGLFKQTKIDEPEEEEQSMDGYQDPVYDPSLAEKVKEQYRSMTLDKLVQNRIELEHFRQFLADNYASMDLLCWMDIEAFRRMPHNDEAGRDAKAKQIRIKYLNKKYFFGPNSPAGKESQNKVMQIGGGWGKLLDDRPPTQVLIEVQKFVRDRLEKKWLPLFLLTPEFEERQNPSVKMDEVVDDVMVQRRRQSAAINKMLESKWVSSSKEIIGFRKALLNPLTSAQFRRYVSLKGDFLENDVLFWREVQTFKNICHLHNEESAIQGKITNIIQCFIDSSIPPSLQIDIRNEQADRIVHKRRELGPYVFREAQLTVFRILVPFWNEFCEYRKGISDETLALKLEKQKRRQKAKMKKGSPYQEKEALKKSTARSNSSSGDSSVRSGGDLLEGAEEAMAEEIDPKNKVQWTYSQYLDCLKREEELNRSDHTSTMSSLA